MNNNNVPYATALLMTGNNVSWSLEYHLQTYTSSAGDELFGVKIDKRNSNNSIVESNETFAITDSYSKAEIITAYLAEGMVRPFELLSVIDDWLSDDEWGRVNLSPPTGRTSRMEA